MGDHEDGERGGGGAATATASERYEKLKESSTIKYIMYMCWTNWRRPAWPRALARCGVVCRWRALRFTVEIKRAVHARTPHIDDALLAEAGHHLAVRTWRAGAYILSNSPAGGDLIIGVSVKPTTILSVCLVYLRVTMHVIHVFIRCVVLRTCLVIIIKLNSILLCLA